MIDGPRGNPNARAAAVPAGPAGGRVDFNARDVGPYRRGRAAGTLCPANPVRLSDDLRFGRVVRHLSDVVAAGRLFHPEEAIVIVRRRERSGIRVSFVLPFDEPAEQVSVVGDFNDWLPGVHVLTRSTYGTRAVAVRLPAGRRYSFSYLTEGGHVFGESDAEWTDAGANVLIT